MTDCPPDRTVVLKGWDPACTADFSISQTQCAFDANDNLVGRVHLARENGVFRYVLSPNSGPVVDPYDPAAFGHTIGICDEERVCARSVDADGETLAVVEIVHQEIDDPTPTVYQFGTTTLFTPGPTHVGYEPCGTENNHEIVVVCDLLASGSVVPFIRRFTFTDDTLTSVTDTTLDGSTPYMVAGSVVVCPADVDDEWQILCDVQANGEATPFIRRYRTDDQGVVTTVDQQLDGVTAYAVTGTVGTCAPTDTEAVVLCDVQAAGPSVRFVRHYVYGPGGVLVDTVDTTLGGLAYNTVGTVELCETTEVEAVVLCDVQDDDTTVEFVRHYIYSPDDGAYVRHFDTLHNGAVYVPTGVEQRDCSPDNICFPDSSQNVNGTCGAGEDVNTDLVDTVGFNLDADPMVDALCADGAWATTSVAPTPPFPIEEEMNGQGPNDPNATLFGHAYFTASGGAEGPDAVRQVTDANGQGWLRLTNALNAEAGGIIFEDTFPSADDIVVEFDYANYGGSGADGFSVFLLDGDDPVPTSLGVNGGQLGYGGSPGAAATNGIASGFVAIGIDEFGNFASVSHVINSPIGFTPDSIALRGSGDQESSFDRYQYIDHAVVAAGLETTRAMPYRVRMSINASGGPVIISVDLDRQDDNGWQRIIDGVDATAELDAVPANFRLGLAGSTGGVTNVHEVRNLRATAAGRSTWRAFTVATDPIPACADEVTVTAQVNVTYTEDTQTGGNADPESYLWIVDDATDTILERAEVASLPSRVGDEQALEVSTTVPVGDVGNLRIYVGQEHRDQAGSYSTLWEDFTVTANALGCPAVPARTVPISAPCPVDVNIVGGAVDGDAVPVLVVNTPDTVDLADICAQVDDGTGGTTQVSAFRRERRTADGTTVIDFVGTDGALINPTTWDPGGCATTSATTPVDWERICYTLVSTGATIQVGFADFNPLTPPTPQTPNGLTFRDANGDPLDPSVDGFTQVPCAGSVIIDTGLVCADGVPAFRSVIYETDGTVRRIQFRAADGVVFTPTTWEPGSCSSGGGGGGGRSVDDECLQDDNGVFYRRTIDDNGTVTVTTVDVGGATYVPVGAVTACGGGQAGLAAYTTQIETVSGTVFNVPGSTDLVGWAVRSRNGTVTLQIDGGTVINLDPGEIFESNRDDGDDLHYLSDVLVVDATAGSARVMIQRRT